ncbi:MAG: MATE family efflux transporter [Steroidobacteraceae bacterium]
MFIQFARTDARAILRLGGPLIVNNLATTGMTFADTVMAGQLGARELAGLAVGVSYYTLSFLIGLGVLMALAPAVAHAYGAGEDARIGSNARQSLWIVLVLSVSMMALLWQAQWVLAAVGINREILPLAVDYCEAISWGLPAVFGFFALRFVSEGIGRTRPIMYIALLGLVLNVIGNWLLIYGKLGFPRLGVVGCAVATAFSMWCMLLVLVAHMRGPAYGSYRIFVGIDAPHGALLAELARMGLPIAGSLLCEGGLFIAAALLMGTMTATIAAAHQIALNYASFMFMLPLAMHSATVIHVGHLLGAGEREGARRAGFIGIAMCGTIMLVSAVVILFANDAIARIYTRDTGVRELAAALLLMAAIFQVSDGLQVGAAGALRGYKDTAAALIVCLVSYWAVGFPLAYVLGVRQGLGPVYVWVGLIAGLSTAAVLLNWRFWRISTRMVRGLRHGDEQLVS